jgi:hypothetical protein
LDYDVLHLELVGDEYEFSAEICCRECGRRSGLKRLLHQLDRITRLKVGPAAVEIELRAGSDDAPSHE